MINRDALQALIREQQAVREHNAAYLMGPPTRVELEDMEAQMAYLEARAARARANPDKGARVLKKIFG